MYILHRFRSNVTARLPSHCGLYPHSWVTHAKWVIPEDTGIFPKSISQNPHKNLKPRKKYHKQTVSSRIHQLRVSTPRRHKGSLDTAPLILTLEAKRK